MKEFDTLAELQGSTQSKTGLRLKCRENLYEYIVQASGYTATGDDVTFANGRVAKCVFVADAKYIKTVGGNVQDDIDSIISGSLPSQAGNEFKFLTTNGTSASWFQGTLQMDTFANLQTFSPTVDGTTFICQERANARYILQTSGYVALPGDVTFANGRVGKLQIDGQVLSGWFASLSDAVSRGRDILCTQDYTISSVMTVNCTSEPFSIDLGGHTLTSDNAGIFSAFGGLLYEQAVSSHTDNTITIGASNSLIDYLNANIDDRPIIKIVSDDSINPADSPSELRGEFVRVKSVTSGVLTLESDLYFTYTTAPRIAALVSEKCTIKNGTLDVTSLATVRGSHIYLTKLNSPEISNIKVVKGNDQGIVIHSSYGALVEKCNISNLTDNAGAGYLGYGVSDAISAYTKVVDCNFSNTRHAYTTNSGSPTPGGDIAGFGAVMYSEVVDCHCEGNSDDAFDTHPNCYFIKFINCTGFGNVKALVKDRGKFTTVINPVSERDGFGIRNGTQSDNLTIINPVTIDTPYSLFLLADVESNVHVEGGVFDLTSSNEMIRLQNINLSGSFTAKYRGSIDFSKMLRMTDSTVNLDSVTLDITESTSPNFTAFEIASGGSNVLDVKTLNVKAVSGANSLAIVRDSTATGTNVARISANLVDQDILTGSTMGAGSYLKSRWSGADSSAFFVTLTASDQYIPELVYNGSPKITMIATVTGSSKNLIALPNGVFVGQQLQIVLSKNSAFNVTIRHGSTYNTDLIGAANITLGQGEALSLMWNGTDWESYVQTY